MSSTPVTPSQTEVDPSALSASSQAPAQQAQQALQDNTSQPTTPTDNGARSAAPTSRLGAILGAVARTVSTGLSGIPDRGRPSFIGGLGQGARAQQQAEATAQAIKFQSFQDQVRAAQLHNEDVRLQMATDDHQTAVQGQADAEAKRMTDSTGMTYTRVPNTAADVTTHMTSDAAQNGGASVSPGTIMGPHAMYVPNKGSDEQAQALTKDYSWRAPAYGLASVPPGRVVQPGAYDQLRQASNGLDNQGHPMEARDIANRAENLTSYLKDNSDKIPSEAKSAIQSDIDHLTDLQTHHAARDQKGIAQATADAATRADKLGAIANKYKEDQQDNAASNKNQGAAPTPDPFGVTSSLPVKEANSRYNTFSKSYVQPLTKTDQTNAQFQSILNDVNSGKDLTGAQSVVSLFDAIGISATPMKGQGFRLNKDVIQEHVQARGVDQSVAQKLGQLKSGEIITPKQIKDYAGIATQARESQYNSAIDEARRQGLPVDFLPKGNGAPLDASTARMYVRAAGGPNNAAKAEAAAQQAGWRL